MSIFLIFLLTFLFNTGPIYALMPSNSGYSEEFDNEKAVQISNEKQNVMASIASVREEREKNIHPFVGTIEEDNENSFDYALKANASMEPERKTPYIKTPAPNIKPKARINFVFISVIFIAFLLSYFFIRPKSR